MHTPTAFVSRRIFLPFARVVLALSLLSLLPLVTVRAAYAQLSGTSTWEVVPSVEGTSSGNAAWDDIPPEVGGGYAIIQPANGTIATKIVADTAASHRAEASAIVQTISGKLVRLLYWKPKNNSFLLDPAPNVVVVHYRPRVRALAFASCYHNPGYPGSGPMSASGSASATCIDATASADASVEGPPDDFDTDEDNWVYGEWRKVPLLVSGNSARLEVSFQLTASSDASCLYPWELTGGKDDESDGHAEAEVDLEVQIAGLDMGRHNGLVGSLLGRGKAMLDGAISWLHSDPSYTRWLPLDFSPIVNNTPFKGVDGKLPPLWGNIHCTYSIGIYREPNPDHNGTGNYYNPPAAGSRIERNSQDIPPGYVLLDANGDRLTFDANFVPASDIKSTFAANATGFTLSNAGPPGRLRERGPYTYRFAAFPTVEPTDPQPARLQSIEDGFGNQQSCVYPGGGSPFMTVTDQTSGRQLIFNTSNDYVTEVIAPNVGTTTPFVRTVLGRDSPGHMTSVSVYAGTDITPILQTNYQYVGDAPTLIQRGSLIQQFAYIDSPSLDIFGNTIPRVSLDRAGSTTDYTTDSPVGRSSSFTYGTISQGYGRYGVDSRTNTFTDALGNQTKYLYHYADPEDGNYNGAIRAVDITGPTFTGATTANVTRYRYTPDMTRYASSDITDTLGRRWAMKYHTVSGMLTELSATVRRMMRACSKLAPA